MMPETFGTLPDGREVQRLTLHSGDLTAQVLTYGAILQDLRLDGVDYPLVLGLNDLAGYLTQTGYFGAIVGRFANRIGGGRFSIDGREYQTDLNFRGRHTLHGGSRGISDQLWGIAELADDRLVLSLDLADGEMGFPGQMRITAAISLAGAALSFDLSAESDAPTPCSLAHHGYFDLDGKGDIRKHSLRIDAPYYLPVDDDLIPTGEVAPVAGANFDFRKLRKIGDAGYDHNFCLSDVPHRPLQAVALLTGESGLSMQVETTACGLQLYDGAYIAGMHGLNGRQYAKHSGLALEAQHWPDAPNHKKFPNAILRPGKVYSQTTTYRFIR